MQCCTECGEAIGPRGSRWAAQGLCGVSIRRSKRRSRVTRTMPMNETTVTSNVQGTIPEAVRQQCDGMATFDDRRFVRRAKRLGLLPPVTLCR